MATHEEARTLVGWLKTEEAQALLAEFDEELRKFSTWSAKTAAFREEIGEPEPGHPSFKNALLAWEANRAGVIQDRMADRIVASLNEQYGVNAVPREDVLEFVKNTMSDRPHK